MRGCAATRDVCSRRDPRGICIEWSRRRTLSSMLHDMLVVGAGPAGILVWERRELIAQMKANCVAFAQAIERESRIVSAGRCNVGAAPFSRGRHLRHGSRR
jgi:hypothetical protein